MSADQDQLDYSHVHSDWQSYMSFPGPRNIHGSLDYTVLPELKSPCTCTGEWSYRFTKRIPGPAEHTNAVLASSPQVRTLADPCSLRFSLGDDGLQLPQRPPHWAADRDWNIEVK